MMRIPIAHDLPVEEVRHRLRSRTHEIANFIPGGMADVSTEWPSDDLMKLQVRAMGQQVDGQVEVEEKQVVFVVNLPPALSFVEPMISGAIRKQGQKLLA